MGNPQSLWKNSWHIYSTKISSTTKHPISAVSVQNTNGFPAVLSLQHLPAVGTLVHPGTENPEVQHKLLYERNIRINSGCLSQKLCSDPRNPYKFVNKARAHTQHTHMHTQIHEAIGLKGSLLLHVKGTLHSLVLQSVVWEYRHFFLVDFIIFSKGNLIFFFAWLDKPLQNLFTSLLPFNKTNPQKKIPMCKSCHLQPSIMSL